jgi:hypothetical protein
VAQTFPREVCAERNQVDRVGVRRGVTGERRLHVERLLNVRRLLEATTQLQMLHGCWVTVAVSLLHRLSDVSDLVRSCGRFPESADVLRTGYRKSEWVKAKRPFVAMPPELGT